MDASVNSTCLFLKGHTDLQDHSYLFNVRISSPTKVLVMAQEGLGLTRDSRNCEAKNIKQTFESPTPMKAGIRTGLHTLLAPNKLESYHINTPK